MKCLQCDFHARIGSSFPRDRVYRFNANREGLSSLYGERWYSPAQTRRFARGSLLWQPIDKLNPFTLHKRSYHDYLCARMKLLRANVVFARRAWKVSKNHSGKIKKRSTHWNFIVRTCRCTEYAWNNLKCTKESEREINAADYIGVSLLCEDIILHKWKIHYHK